MGYDPRIHHRRSIRLPKYDYRSPGAYFITLLTKNRACLFGSIEHDTVTLSQYGEIAAESRQWLAHQYSYIELDEWVIMPNHLHAILWILDTDSRNGPPNEKIKPLGSLIGAFKTVSTKQINLFRRTPGEPIWQRNYYEHIIRNERSIENIQVYIRNNPCNWDEDQENPLYRRSID